MNNYIGLNIKFIYETKKLSQEDFGKIFGLKKSAVSSYVNQRASPPYEVSIQIADHFGLTLDDLIRRPLNQGDFTGITPKSDHVSPQPPDPATWIEKKTHDKLLSEKDKHITLQDKYIQKLEKEIEELEQQKKSTDSTSYTAKHSR